ncbi:OsmC-like protein [Roseivivax jejudonensis]|uniref:OsmC-like protein n=1 Tax=Roseivivax jejudonensis TaxID=1529041 RepID=A0A1X7A590_9RHOB|nr:OsmC family protein [Roseivivax jejudonensis]SLN70900.1 OsmC-like protein [Roseivivax jejudonensis]
MPATMPPNVLAESGLPLAFATMTPRLDTFGPPEPRLGTALRASVRSLTVMQKEAIVTSTRFPGRSWRLASDEGAYLGGHDQAPPPLAFLSAGMVASYFAELSALAEARGVPMTGVELVQDNFYWMRGSALKGTMEAGARDVNLEIRAPATNVATLRDLAPDAVAASPLDGLMRAPVESLFTLHHNGAPLGLLHAKPVDGPPVPDPGPALGDLQPDPGDWSALVRGTGEPAPRNEATTTFAGGALTETQDRILHVRVRAHRRSDGMLSIVLHLFNPAGTIFHFISAQDGRAPDAETLICAGIGFCFMTQFGRYSKIAKKNLSSYRIVQDAHFSLAGASDGTGARGTATPLETHVHLHSSENDDFARTALDTAERTCFLHAFCRASLKARIRVTGTDEANAA